MGRFSGGWRDLEKEYPFQITNVIASAIILLDTGTIVDSTDYNSPTGGIWGASPLVLHAAPRVRPIDTLYGEKTMYAEAMNMQIKTADLNAPPPLQNLIYLVGNEKDDFRYSMELAFTTGGNTLTTIEISILENLATTGDKNGCIEVIKFTNNNWMGLIPIILTIHDYQGEINLGIRTELTSGLHPSSILNLRCRVIPANFYENLFERLENTGMSINDITQPYFDIALNKLLKTEIENNEIKDTIFDLSSDYSIFEENILIRKK